MMGRLLLASCLLATVACAQSTLTTTFASNNGQSGNMFDIEVTTAANLQSFSLNLDPGTWDIEIWAVTAGTTWVGNEDTAAAWSLIQTVPGVVSAGTDVPTPLGLALAYPVAPGGLRGFYITCTNGTGMNYTNGSATGALYATDGVLSVHEGCGKSYSFGATFQPRVWNGEIVYTTGPIVPVFQLNQPGASLDIDGVNTVGLTPAQTSLPANATGTVAWAALGSATTFDVALTLGDTTIAGGLVPGSQLFNLNLFSPSFTWAFGGDFTTGFFPVSTPFSFPPGTPTIQAQMTVLDASSPDGYYLSQPLDHTTL